MLRSSVDPGDVRQGRSTTATAAGTRIRKRRIIERPRLFALLDESKARVRMLVGPAGYGKTTLAEQWVARDGRRGVWFTARSSSTDVAALALGVARSATLDRRGVRCAASARIFGRCPPQPRTSRRSPRFSARISQTGRRTRGLCSTITTRSRRSLARRTSSRRSRSRSVLYAFSSRAALDRLGSRRRDLLYGIAYEVNQTALAMDDEEATDVLVERGAAVGVGSCSSRERMAGCHRSRECVVRRAQPRALNEYQSRCTGSSPTRSSTHSAPDVRQGLTTLAVAPLLDYELATALLGRSSRHGVMSAALDVGLLVEREQRLDLHPLARAFLEERSAQLGLVAAEELRRTLSRGLLAPPRVGRRV